MNNAPIISLSADATVWWRDPKGRRIAAWVTSVNRKTGTAIIEYMDATRQTFRQLVNAADLDPRPLPVSATPSRRRGR
ncbi:MAG: hypothetical protein WC683_04875 [bacterium]